MLNTVNLFIALVVAAITYGTPLLFGTLGEVLTEKSGSLNLGVEGIMFMGGAIGLGGVFYYEKAVESPSAFLAVLIGLLCAFIAGGIASLIFSFLTITLRANQNVTGLALTIFGTGVGQYIGEIMRIREGGFVAVGNDLKAVFISSPFPQAMQDIPYVGKILFGNSIFFYLGVVLAIVMHLFLNKSRTGLQLRSVGESPATADAAGINVSRYRYLGAIIGGGISAVGGMVYITTIAGCVWNHEGLSGVGWLAVALVIFCLWRPLSAIWGSVLFGALMILYLRLTIPFIPTQLYKILPYVVTLVVLIIVCAAALAAVVLYNLISVNLAERKKELATIKVLGFYDKEVYRYIFREIELLALIGSGVGLALGVPLHKFIVLTVEMDQLMFIRTIAPRSYLLAVALTMVFTVLVCFVMRRHVKKISMVESMKAPE